MTGAGMTVAARCAEMYSATHTTLTSGVGAEPHRLEHNREANALVSLAAGEREGNTEYIQKTLGINLGVRRSRGAQVNDASGFSRGVAHGKTVQLRRNLLS